MKTKNKTIALLEIAIVLCSLFLVATLPGLAADQTTQKVSTTTSEDDYVLDIYGNANEDDTIDMRDITFTARIILWLEDETYLADANYDGKISVGDMWQEGLIILGRESELTLIDSGGRIVTVEKPAERVFVTFSQLLELLRAINMEPDRIVGVELEDSAEYNELFFPEFLDKPTAGSFRDLDCEAILNEYPDTVLVISDPASDACQEVLESAGITVLRFYAGVWGHEIAGEMKKLGYIFDKRDEAEEFVDFINKYMNSIEETVEEIPEEDKPKVYFETRKWSAGSEMHAQCERAGGKNIFPEGGTVDPEAIIDEAPAVIVIGTFTYSGGYHLDATDTAEIEEIRDELMSRHELEHVKAVEDKRVYVITGWLRYSGPASGCKGFLQTVYMVKWFHPSLFSDLYPQEIHQEYLTRFQRLDYDLDEKGVFVYP